MASARVFAPDTPDHIKLPDGTRKPVPARMSVTEFMDFPWPEDERWELIWGAPTMTPAPGPFHQSLSPILMRWMLERMDDLPEFVLFQDEDVLFPGDSNYLRPDISVFQRNEIEMKVPVAGVPKLVVELLSPSTGGRDWGEKKHAYAEAGVPEYWIADPSTGALTIHLEPAKGNYTPRVMDADGLLASPFFGTRLRIKFDGKTYVVESRD